VAGDRLPGPRKRFGQHFLTDRHTLERIVDALAPGRDDTVVEIGPGRGALTDLLSARCRRLIALEIDRDLVKLLTARYEDRPQVEIIEGDALEADWSAMTGPSYLLAGNLPYYITTPLIFRILESPRPKRAVLLVQREVADRLTATPGTGDYGALSVNVQVSAAVKTVGRVSAGAFHPRPKVDSAIVLLTPLEQPWLGAGEETPFRKFVQAAFSMRRKQLIRILRDAMGLDADEAATLLSRLHIAGSRRPETLPPAEFVQLFRAVTGQKNN
jgi:16S rRNA (adenine1518-N6/adenine1519-N6)-dimethyltransferase